MSRSPIPRVTTLRSRRTRRVVIGCFTRGPSKAPSTSRGCGTPAFVDIRRCSTSPASRSIKWSRAIDGYSSASRPARNSRARRPTTFATHCTAPLPAAISRERYDHAVVRCGASPRGYGRSSRCAESRRMTSPTSLDDARAALREHFGYPDFRPGQSQAVESVLQGQDTLVVLPTGGGKSICYQVPALILPHLTVVISPLISLMKDQVDALARRGLPATFVNSSLTASQVADRLARVQRGEFKLLYVAPERFDVGSTAERLKALGVSLLAIDEAHCISEWGHDFRPSYLRIAQVRERLGLPPVVASTATATPQLRTDIVRQLKLDHGKTIITGFDRRNLRYHVVSSRTEQDKDEALVGILRAAPGLAVVYASTRRTVERITNLLNDARVASVAYPAGLDDAHRREVQDAFMKERVRVIVATNAFGMGIDKPNVRLVVHYAMPGTLEAYYQEAGRAGRDGEPADCFLLHSFQDRFTHEFFIKGSYPERDVVEKVHRVLLRSASSTGDVDLSAEDIAAGIRDKVNVREVEGT